MNRQRLIFLAVAVIALFLVISKLTKKIEIPAVVSSPEVAHSPDKPASHLTTGTVSRVAQDGSVMALGPGPGMIEKYSRGRIVSDKAQEEFSEIGKVQMKFPEHFRFQPLDLDFDQITGIYSRTENMEVSVLAGRVLPTEKEVIEFLKSKDSGIPNVDGEGVTLRGNAVVVPSLSGSGLKSGKYWQGRTSDNKGVRVGLAERADGKGSYLFIFTGSENKLDNSEDFFEELYQNLKALPQ